MPVKKAVKKAELTLAERMAEKDKAAHDAWVSERESAHKGNIKVRRI